MVDWFVYLIRCNNDTLYTGITTNVTRRFKEHNAQGKRTAKFLRGKTPITLVGYFKTVSRSNAQKMECKIKKLSKQEKEALFD